MFYISINILYFTRDLELWSWRCILLHFQYNYVSLHCYLMDRYKTFLRGTHANVTENSSKIRGREISILGSSLGFGENKPGFCIDFKLNTLHVDESYLDAVTNSYVIILSYLALWIRFLDNQNRTGQHTRDFTCPVG